MSDSTIAVQRLPKGRIVCTVTVDEAQFLPAEKEALARLGRNVQIKGFRPGNAPENLLRERIPQDRLFEEAVRILLQTLLPRAIEQEKIQPVIPPKVEVASRMPLKLSITFVEKPEVSIKKIDQLAPAKKEITADPKDVQNVIHSVLLEHRMLQETDDPAGEGDQVTMDFSARDDQGREMEGMHATNYEVVIGEKQLLPGFEDALKGLIKNESKTFALTLPENFHVKELSGKQATFHVEIRKVEHVTLPELTDDFAKEKLGNESAAAFRQLVEESVRRQEEQFARMSRERELMENIRKHTSVDIADELIDEEVRGMIDEWASRLESRGKTIADVLKEEGKTVEETEAQMRTDAVERWKLRLGIAKLIEEKKVTLSEEELNAAFARFQANVPEEQRGSALEEWKKKGAMYEEVRWRAMVDKLVEKMLNATDN